MAVEINSLRKNAEGYNDNTAYQAILHVTVEENKHEKEVNEFIEKLYAFCDNNGMTIEGNVCIRIKNVHRIYRKQLGRK